MRDQSLDGKEPPKECVALVRPPQTAMPLVMACICSWHVYLGSPAQYDEKAVRKEKEHIKLFSLTDLF